MPSRAHMEAVVQRQCEALARGDMSPEEKAEFASQQKAQDHAAWLRKRPELAAPELPLENGQESDHLPSAPFPEQRRAA